MRCDVTGRDCGQPAYACDMMDFGAVRHLPRPAQPHAMQVLEALCRMEAVDPDLACIVDGTPDHNIAYIEPLP